MNEKIRVIRKRPGEDAEIVEIENTLKSLQREVGGYIETLTLFEDATFLVNEEGKLLGLEPNFFVLSELLVGTVLLVGIAGEDFCSLSDEQIKDAGTLFPSLGVTVDA